MKIDLYENFAKYMGFKTYTESWELERKIRPSSIEDREYISEEAKTLTVEFIEQLNAFGKLQLINDFGREICWKKGHRYYVLQSYTQNFYSLRIDDKAGYPIIIYNFRLINDN